MSPKPITKGESLNSKSTKNRFAFGLCPNPLGELTALIQTKYLNLGEGLRSHERRINRKGEREWSGKEREGK